MTVIAVTTGSSKFLPADFSVICISLWNCLEVINRRKPKSEASQTTTKSSVDISRYIGVIILIGTIGYIFLTSSTPPKANPPIEVKTASTPQETSRIASPPYISPTQHIPPQQTTVAKTPEKSRTAKGVEKCLKIVNEDKMVECLEKTN
jgi:hypothetical protein